MLCCYSLGTPSECILIIIDGSGTPSVDIDGLGTPLLCLFNIDELGTPL